jgi:hypothetical protein
MFLNISCSLSLLLKQLRAFICRIFYFGAWGKKAYATIIIYGVTEMPLKLFLKIFYLSKKLKSWNKGLCYIKCWNVHHVQWCMLSLFSSRLMQPDKKLPQWQERFIRRDFDGFCRNSKIGKCVPRLILGKLNKNEVACNFRRWTISALVKNASLHIDCWRTTDGLAREGIIMTGTAWSLA